MGVFGGMLLFLKGFAGVDCWCDFLGRVVLCEKTECGREWGQAITRVFDKRV